MSVTAEERAKMEYIDYLRPIIADGDTGLVLVRLSFVWDLMEVFNRHGGLSTVLKLVKIFAESVSRVFEVELHHAKL